MGALVMVATGSASTLVRQIGRLDLASSAKTIAPS
jgi:hypothetical protein